MIDGRAVVRLNPDGPNDPRVKVLRFDDGSSLTPLAVVMHAVCHPCFFTWGDKGCTGPRAALDPLAAALIWLKPRIGFATTLAIVISDVAVNSYGVHWLGYHGWQACGSLQLQAMFLGFVVGSLPLVWGDQGQREPE